MARASADTPSREARLEAGLSYGGRPLDVSLSPWLPTNLQAGLLRRHVPALFRAALQATARFVREPSFRARFGYGSLQEECILKDPGYEPDIPLGRLDGFLKDESLKFLEFNTDGAAGWHYQAAVNALARDRLGLKSEPLPLPHRLLTALLKLYGLWSSDASRRPSVALVDYAEVPTRSEQEGLVATFSKAGVPCTLEDPRALRFEGGRLVGSAGPIELVYRRVVSEDLFARAGEVRPFLEAYLAGAACFVGSFRSDPAWSKTLFAVLSDPGFLETLPPADRASLAESVPFTAPLADGPLAYRGSTFDARRLLKEERPYFVVKPARGYAGRGVMAGAFASARAWETFLDGAFKEPGWVVQEFVEPARHPLPHGGKPGFLHVGTFVLTGGIAGLMARLSALPVLSHETPEIWLPAEMPPGEA